MPVFVQLASWFAALPDCKRFSGLSPRYADRFKSLLPNSELQTCPTLDARSALTVATFVGMYTVPVYLLLITMYSHFVFGMRRLPPSAFAPEAPENRVVATVR